MSDQSNKISASPKVRKFARELGVDINQVKGSERKGRVVESDIKLFVASKSKNILRKKILCLLMVMAYPMLI